MVSYDAAVEILQKKAVSLQSPNERDGKQIWEEVYLMDAVGRVAATEVVSPTATPQFDTHAMDGYAVCSEATVLASPERPLLLRVCGTIAAGDGPMELDGCVAGTTKRFDACVRVEDTAAVFGAGTTGRMIMITKPVPSDASRRPAGCDIQLEERIVKGIRVFKKPRVAVWSTGKALMAGEASNIPDVNGPFLVAALREAGAQPTFLGTLHDNEDAVMGALRDTIDGGLFGLVLTTGGVSVGKFDFVASSLGALGAKTHFHGVAMRPGHPVLFAQVPGLSHDLPFFGLLGNAGATAACFRFLVVPFLRSWQHQTAETPIMAECVEDTSTDSREAASPGIPRMTSSRHGIMQQGKNGDVLVEFSKQQSPAKLGPFINANCWVRLGGQSQGSRREGRVACFYMPVHAAV
ncbi:hypothetical protein LY78DRAFT_750273 [Colletotrichum sublineola]|nr:hypothetical protein LY78DRAFT_750273 [Colletotrichum sublineola]